MSDGLREQREIRVGDIVEVTSGDMTGMGRADKLARDWIRVSGRWEDDVHFWIWFPRKDVTFLCRPDDEWRGLYEGFLDTSYREYEKALREAIIAERAECEYPGCKYH